VPGRVDELATLAAIDFEDFYAARRPVRGKTGDLLVLSADGEGIVMRPDALRTGTATRAARAGPKPEAQPSRGEQLSHKRMAEIGAVYDATPAPRTPADILTSDRSKGHEPAPGPVATNKCVTASVIKTPAAVIKRIFEEADRRDPKHRSTWVALVDGANHQIHRINFEAKIRAINVKIIVDFVHVLHKLCLHCPYLSVLVTRSGFHRCLCVIAVLSGSLPVVGSRVWSRLDQMAIRSSGPFDCIGEQLSTLVLGVGISIARRLRRPRLTWIARSSPRLTRSSTVWRATPSIAAACVRPTQPGGSSGTIFARSSSSTWMCHGPPGVSWKPAMNPSRSQR
jgi:hypothetical protein